MNEQTGLLLHKIQEDECENDLSFVQRYGRVDKMEKNKVEEIKAKNQLKSGGWGSNKELGKKTSYQSRFGQESRNQTAQP